MANLMKWYITDSTKYAALGTKDNDTLYFLSDTQEIYKGELSFTTPTVFFATGSKPAKGAAGKIYFDQTTLEGSIWNGAGWTTVIQPIAQSIDHDAPTAGPVSGVAVKAYVQSRLDATKGDFVTDITYDGAAKKLTFVKNSTNHEVVLSKLFAGATYDGSTGKITFTDAENTEVASLNIPLDNFVKNGYYDNTKEALVLEMTQGNSVEIPAADLVALYEVADTNSVDMTIENGATGNVIKADVKVSAEQGNGLSIKADGLYAAATDISGKVDKVAADHADEILLADATGNAALSGKKVGGATLAGTPNANTVATEAAVAAVRTAIETAAASTYVAKADISTTIPATPGDAVDTKVASEKAVSTAIDTLKTSLTQDAADKYVLKTNVVANEAGIDAVSSSSDKVISEKAFVEAMSWHVL